MNPKHMHIQMNILIKNKTNAFVTKGKMQVGWMSYE